MSGEVPIPEEAIKDFQSETPGDLNFKKNQVFVVLSKPTSKGAWWFGQIGDQFGIFPPEYVKLTN